MQARFVGVWEIEQRFGVSRQRVHQLIARPDWPVPYEVLAMGRIWLRDDVEAWAARHRSEIVGDPDPGAS